MYKNFGKVIVRTPLLSYEDLIKKEDQQGFDFNRLIAVKLNDPCFMETLYWASPDIYHLSLQYKQGLLKAGKKESKFLHALKKYIIRAGSRATPYGLFAGCAVADIIDGNASVSYSSTIPMAPERKVRLDMRVLGQLVDHIKLDEAVIPHLHYRANSSLYQVQGSYRYLEYLLKNGQREYQLSSIERTEVLDDILQACQLEMRSREDIFALIGEVASQQEKYDFVQELIQSQFLVAEIELGVTEKDQLLKLSTFFNPLALKEPSCRKYLELIIALTNMITEFEAVELGSLPFEKIAWLSEQLASLGIEVEGEVFLQADLFRPETSGVPVSSEIVAELLEATRVLSLFTSKSSVHEQRLKEFKKTFIEKYETQEIPFAEVSDMEMGIGFPVSQPIGNVAHHPYMEEVKPLSSLQKSEPTQKWHEFLQHKAGQIRRSDRKGIVLRSNELSAFSDKMDQLSGTMSILFSSLPDGKLLWNSAGGATANSLIGRFAYLNEDIEALCKKIAEEDSRLSGDAILAEIVHLPEGKVGNVIRRLNLNHFEIPFLSEPGLDADHVIPINDLMISVQYDQVVLRSKSLNKRVIPRLSCAHNYTGSDLSAYQLLCALQHQGKTGINISLGHWSKGRKFFPRITYGSVILALASWHFKPEDYGAVLLQDNPAAALRNFLQSWDLPRFFALTEGDNELFFDLNEDSYLEILIVELKKNRPLRFIEWLHFDARDQQKRWVNQYVLPLYKISDKDENHPDLADFETATSVKRSFPPGSEWIYFKFYCGAHLSDEILEGLIRPVSEYLLSRQLSDQFFFIRYNDPNYHIRYRIHLNNYQKNDFAEVIEYINQALEPYLVNRTIWKVQLDTYQRELERYGPSNIVTTEYLFFEDSQLYLQLLAAGTFLQYEHIRLFAALKNIDSWLELFDLDLHEKMLFTEQMANVFLKEFGNECKIKIAQQYRELRMEINQYMQGSEINELFLGRGLKKSDLSRENLASYIHMSINRWFKTEQRLMEYYVYSFCAKYYKTRTNHSLV
ncbi:lantibiotic dehydratase [Pedobacter gandavensis]|uniref:lantibiotic dehydratase n=1 Tax=Pedobacter gandavensis TaxID=2679963 RepID=UPI00292EF7B8|nr:lantibiotic dehydratase [Pedobacter gandavensis]